ncbi:MAG: tyrosine-type recombinase/integrase [Oscillibacter sp.]|nr:tyrosine-type recombinase/integrase [Oscillibacter sp.]
MSKTFEKQFYLLSFQNILGDENFLLSSYETGARLREVLSVTLNDIDRSGDFIPVRIMGKGSRVRTVPLMPEVAAHQCQAREIPLIQGFPALLVIT